MTNTATKLTKQEREILISVRDSGHPYPATAKRGPHVKIASLKARGLFVWVKTGEMIGSMERSRAELTDAGRAALG